MYFFMVGPREDGKTPKVILPSDVNIHRSVTLNMELFERAEGPISLPIRTEEDTVFHLNSRLDDTVSHLMVDFVPTKKRPRPT